MSELAKAVFLSYASQDAEAAKRICDELRAAGVEVWFDQSELVGGDAWDQKIRKQIRECALLIPIISKTTQGRREAYFRLEWKLADERTHLMAKGTPFLLPVTIDDTGDRQALVPDSFLAVQWTKAPGGEVAPAFCARVKKLLGGEVDVGRDRPIPPRDATAGSGDSALQPKPWRWQRPVLAASVIVAAALAITLIKTKSGETGQPVSAVSPPAPPNPAPVSEARQLLARARALLNNNVGNVMTRDKLEAAEDLCRRALALDSSDAEVWAESAGVDAGIVYYGFDSSEERRQQAQRKASRALALAPDDFEARHAQASVFGYASGSPAMLGEAVKLYRALVQERPADQNLQTELGTVLRDLGRFDEAAAVFEKIDDLGSAGWNYILAGRNAEARRVADKWVHQGRNINALLLQAAVEYYCEEDLAATQRTVNELTPTELLEDQPAMCAAEVALDRRDPATAIRVLTAFPGEYLSSPGGRGPKRYQLGLALELEGKADAARDEWSSALRVVRERQKVTPNDSDLLAWEAVLQACLGERAEADRLLGLYRSKPHVSGLAGQNAAGVYYGSIVELRLGRLQLARDGLESLHHANPRLFAQIHCWIRFGPDCDPLRGDPKFEQLLRETLPSGARPFEDAKPPTKL
jgi:tetratricopeptide (TPR) repeat protein